jgi:Helix-turn-helix domain
MKNLCIGGQDCFGAFDHQPARLNGEAVLAGVLSVGRERLPVMPRHTTFRFCLDPTVEQYDVLARHAGAARFAFNQCLRTVKTALTRRETNPDLGIPWTGFDLINSFNAWKKTGNAGRVFTVDSDGVIEIRVIGLSWRTEVCQQVFEEAAVDLGKGLKARTRARVNARANASASRVSRRRPAQSRRFGCVISTTRAGHLRSGSATTIDRVPLRCRGSGRLLYTMTPAGCDACSPRTAPRSCSPPSPDRAGTGGCR